MPTIALIGPGAIGGLVSTWLCQNKNNDVTVCARTPISGIQLQTPDGTIDAKPTVLTCAAQGEEVDWVLVATKACDPESAAANCSRLRKSMRRQARTS